MSNFLNLNLSDLIKGAYLAALSVFVGGLYQIIQTILAGGTLGLPGLNQIEDLLKLAIAAFISYLAKNLFTNSAGKPFAKDPQ